MEKLTYQLAIAAPKEKVWQVLWGQDTYPQWTAAFSEGSRAETDWQEGSKVLFLSGTGDGMVSQIAAKRENEFMSFKHLGMVLGGVEDTTSDNVKAWAGSLENYFLDTIDGKTNLRVELEVQPEWKDDLAKMWPAALESLQQLCEA